MASDSKYYFDDKAADTAVNFIEKYCHHIAGEWANPRNPDGTPRDTRIKLADWQRDEIIRPLFGWRVKETGARKYTTLYVEIPKKNGKSALSACIELIFLYIDQEPGSELYIACPVSKDQAASLLLEPARAMIEKSPKLSSAARIMGTKNYTKSILVGDTFLKPLTRDAAASEGIKPQAAFIDETHVFKDAGVIENLEKSMIIRQQPLVCYTTTAGDNMVGVGYQKSQYYKDVKAGKIDDPSALVVIYGAEPDDDPFDEKVWEKANPMWNISINQDQFRKEAEKAKQSAASLNAFKRYHLNIWTGAIEAWIPDHEWQESVWDVDEEYLQGLECYGGLDLGATSDVSAFTLLFVDGDRYISKNWFWLPEQQADISAQDQNRFYLDWVRDGFIKETPGRVTDYDFIVNKMLETAKEYNVLGIGYDPYQATSVGSKMLKEGYEGLFAVRTGYRTISEPTKKMHDLVRSGKFNHLNNPVLRWMVGNVVLKMDDNGNIKPDRGKRRHKIDGVLSNLYALTLKMEKDKEEEEGSYLDDNEPIVF